MLLPFMFFACSPDEKPSGGSDSGGGGNNGGGGGNNGGGTTEVVATAIKLNKNTLSLNKGASETLTVTYTPDNVTNKTLEWSSSKPAVATVKDGKVTAVAAGSTEITVKCGNVSDKCNVTVVVPATSITLNATERTINERNIIELKATVKPDDCTETVTWESSKTSVATVSNGSVTGKGYGEAVITAKVGSKKAECKVTVIPTGAVDLGDVVTRKDGSKYRLFWADRNIDASNPDKYGNYFAWGEYNVHYTKLSPLTWKSGMEDGYDWTTYKWAKGSKTKLTKYCPSNQSGSWGGSGNPDNKLTLDKEDDVACQVLGGRWRMPTSEEWQALLTQCKWEASTWNGTKGVKVKSKASGNTNEIFLPFAGSIGYTWYTNQEDTGFYWAKDVYKTASDAYHMEIHSDINNISVGVSLRCFGQSVRAVWDLP